MPFIAIVAFRLLRARTLWLASVASALVVAILLAVYASLSSLTLSSAQVVDRDLGRFAFQMGFGVGTVPPGSDVPRRVSGLADSLAPDGDAFAFLAILGMTDPDGSSIVVQEGPWQREPYPGRYRLVRGQWSASPGEVVLAVDSARASQEFPPSLSLLGGSLRLRVVGVAVDRFPSDRTTYLLGPGTWAATTPSITRSFAAVEASLVVAWRDASPDQMIEGVADGYRDIATSPTDQASALRASLIDRADRRASAPASWVTSLPAGFTLPALLFPILVVGSAYALTRLHLDRRASSLIEQGVRPGVVAVATTVSLSVPVLSGVLAGVTAGVTAAYGARPLLAIIHSQPLSQMPPLGTAIATLLGSTTLGLFLVMALRWHDATKKKRPRQRRAPDLERVRRVSALIIVVCVAWSVPLDTSIMATTWQTALLGVAMVLLAPEMLRAGCTLLGTGVRGTLARRSIERDGWRATGAVALMTLMIGVAGGFLVVLYTGLATLTSQVRPDVLPGQVLLVDRAVHVRPPADATVSAMTGIRPWSDAANVPIFIVSDFGTTDGIETAAFVAGAQDDYLMAVRRPSDIARLLRSPLTEQQRNVLRRGGLLLFESRSPSPSAGGAGSADLVLTRAGRDAARVTLPAIELPVRRVEWLDGKAGFVLAETATQNGLPLRRGPAMLTDLTQRQVDKGRAVLLDRPVDPGTVLTYAAPRLPVVPAAVGLVAVTLTLISALVLLSDARARVRALRPYLGRLLSIGLSPRWLRSVLILQQLAIALAGSMGAGAVIAIPVVFASATASQGYLLAMPWAHLGMLFLAVQGGALIAALEASRHLRPS